ncbi:MAG TPA: glycosyltransferase [Candidatus Baltobacteraceae bacterium]|jgi:hypothetical protein|nr:glycosyltransferase [Candidatus Baltobacteraceae bacterium]
MIERDAAYVLLTDGPPLNEGGHGCSVLASNWLRAMKARVRLVVTHRLLPQVELSWISEASPAPVVFYPDLSRFHWAAHFGRLKSLVELGLFWLASRRVAKAIKATSAERMFAFFGGNAWFLLTVKIMARRTGLPLDVYLVDDLEESCRLNGQSFLARFARWLEPRVLRRANRVFVISPGFADHLRAKYGIHALWLPIPFREEKVVYQPFVPRSPDIREIVFFGAVNDLYVGALRDFLGVVTEWNDEGNPSKIKLLIMSYAEPDFVARQLSGMKNWELLYRRSTDECRRIMRDSWAVFLPYSFKESVRVMVGTSFPSRLSECMTSGRPLLVYGPPYATLPRYFLANGLPVCVQSRPELKAAFRTIEQVDSSGLIAKYQAVLNRYHSREAIAGRMAESVSAATTERHERL